MACAAPAPHPRPLSPEYRGEGRKSRQPLLGPAFGVLGAQHVLGLQHAAHDHREARVDNQHLEPLGSLGHHLGPVHIEQVVELVEHDQLDAEVCPLPAGGMYVLQAADPAFYPPVDKETGYGKPHQVCWMGGWVFSKYDPQGRRLFTVPLPDHCTGLDWVPNVGRTEDCGAIVGVYTALQLYHYSPDGLLLGVLSPTHQTGWLDHNGSISINRNPQDSLVDVFAEESFCNRISWYRLDDRGVQTLKVAVTKAAVADERYADESSFYELFHAAQAKQKAGEHAAAGEAFGKALELASDRERPFVHHQLKTAKQKIEQLAK